MKYYRLLLLAALLISLSGAISGLGATAQTDTDPFAEAGLDQEAQVGDAVLLDGGGSRSPTETLTEYQWEIEDPSGSIQEPACHDCVRTEFVPEQSGTYTVQLTVTDSEGYTDTDTLYVSVGSIEAPRVSVTGDSTPTVEDTVTYTATIDSAEASISRIEWRVDGTLVDSTERFEDRTHTLTQDFSAPGERVVEATAVDIDGRTAHDDLDVDVRSPSDTTPSPGPSVSIEGDRVVTGDRPLDGQYQLTGSDASDVDAVRWFDEDGERRTGKDTTIEWTPGSHRLYAMVDFEGTTHRVTFPEGEDVLADPAPEVDLTVDREGDIVTGDIVATDEFESLDTVSIYVAGEEISETTFDESRARYEESFSTQLPDDSSQTRIRAVATDSRGQAATAATEQGRPELISSGFVNTPVDSYHERIDEDRYTAVHELVVDLNGESVEEGMSSFQLSPNNNTVSVIKEPTREYHEKEDHLIINSYWGAENIGAYRIHTTTGDKKVIETSLLKITPSPPEVHVEIIDPGGGSHDRGYRVRIDPSDSFDPDGTELRYKVADRNRTSAKEDDLGIEYGEKPVLTVIDRQGQSTTYELDLYDFYVPEIDTLSQDSTGPYSADDTVSIGIQTERYQIAAPEYDLNLGVDVENGSGTVESWRVVDPQPSHENTEDVAQQNALVYSKGVIEIDAKSFVEGGQPELTVYNTGDPDGNSYSLEVPQIDDIMLKPHNVGVEDIEYTVDAFLKERTASSASERIQLEGSGYQVDSTNTTVEAVELEKKEASTTESTKSYEFDSRSKRNSFARSRTNRSKAGTRTETVLNRRTVWRDSFTGTGQYTGNTRTVRNYHRSSPSSGPPVTTEYEFRTTERETVVRYLAESTVRETTSYWASQGKTTMITSAKRQAQQDSDVRIASTTERTTWNLSKLVHREQTVQSYDDPSYVQKTSGTVSGDMLQPPYTKSEDPVNTTKVDEFSVDASLPGLRSEQELMDAVTGDEPGADCESVYQEVC